MRVQWALCLVIPALAGCFSGDSTPDFPYYDDADGLYHFQWQHDGQQVHFDWSPGGTGKFRNDGDRPVELTLPHHFIHLSEPEGGTFSLGGSPVSVGPGEMAYHLAPPSATTVDVQLGGTTYTLDSAETGADGESWRQVVSGENVYELEIHQHENFPNREPGYENYYLAAQYFADYYSELGYEVEIDPYGTHALTNDGTVCVPIRGGTICPESLLNVVATKPGTDPDAGTIFVAGGHYDMVTGTTHAAFDDTSGTVSAMELARALAPFEFRHTIKFAAWGGEENGILGSQFWIQTNPQARQDVVAYWNLDVVGMSWPAPLLKPDPIVIAAGPDIPSDASGGATGPIAAALLDQARQLQQDWFAFPAEGQDNTGEGAGSYPLWYYEGIASGQVAGYAGVNAQSDHTPFAAAGIPAYFIFNGDTLAGDNLIGIHNERDTVWNMTKYAYFAHLVDLDEPNPWESQEQFDEAKKILAQSWETVMFFPFYHALLLDLGHFDDLSPA